MSMIFVRDCFQAGLTYGLAGMIVFPPLPVRPPNSWIAAYSTLGPILTIMPSELACEVTLVRSRVVTQPGYGLPGVLFPDRFFFI